MLSNYILTYMGINVILINNIFISFTFQSNQTNKDYFSHIFIHFTFLLIQTYEMKIFSFHFSFLSLFIHFYFHSIETKSKNLDIDVLSNKSIKKKKDTLFVWKMFLSQLFLLKPCKYTQICFNFIFIFYFFSWTEVNKRKLD